MTFRDSLGNALKKVPKVGEVSMEVTHSGKPCGIVGRVGSTAKEGATLSLQDIVFECETEGSPASLFSVAAAAAARPSRGPAATNAAAAAARDVTSVAVEIKVKGVDSGHEGLSYLTALPPVFSLYKDKKIRIWRKYGP